MKYLVPKPATQRAFVRYWSKRYSYKLEPNYTNNINKRPLTEDAVLKLYKWKNGGNIAKGKLDSVKSYYVAALEELPEVSDDESGAQYLDQLGGGAIWNIFWLHCLNPKRFPIFDQHTYRAMADIRCLPEQEIPRKKSDKVCVYWEKYVPFWRNFNSRNRNVDKALFAYGKFLKG